MPQAIDNTNYSKKDFVTHPFEQGEYESCTFDACDFSNADFSECKFIDCTFINCNLSMVKLVQAMFQDTHFKGCKMLGLQFDSCKDFALSFTFENCTLDHATFFRKKIKKTLFRNSHLHNVDFTECDLTAALFDHCDLLNAKFEHTVLEKADFRTSTNYAIDPEINKIRKAKFSLPGVIALLDKYDLDIERLA